MTCWRTAAVFPNTLLLLQGLLFQKINGIFKHACIFYELLFTRVYGRSILLCLRFYAIKLARMEKQIGMLRPVSSELEVPVASVAGDESVTTVLFRLEGAIGTSGLSSGGGACVTRPMSSSMGASPASGIWSTGEGAGMGAICVKPATQ